MGEFKEHFEVSLLEILRTLAVRHIRILYLFLLTFMFLVYMIYEPVKPEVYANPDTPSLHQCDVRPLSKPTNRSNVVFVAVVTSPQTMDRVWAVENTWKTTCEAIGITVRYIMARVPDETIEAAVNKTVYNPLWPTIKLTPPNRDHFVQLKNVNERKSHFITAKTVNMWIWLYKNRKLDDYDWYFKCDDDTFVRGDALIRHLSQFDPNEPFFIGRIIAPNNKDGPINVSGGAGYVFSRALLKKIGPHLESCLQESEEEWGEDVVLTRCMDKFVGIKPTHLQSFYPHPPREMWQWQNWDRSPYVFWQHDAATFHYIQAGDPFRFHYLLNIKPVCDDECKACLAHYHKRKSLTLPRQ